jgi:hypothetical protein
LPVIVCVGFDDSGQRIESGYQLLDLGPRLTQPSVQLVDQRGGSLQSRHQYVHIDLSLLKESDDGVELPTGVGVAQFLDGDWWFVCDCHLSGLLAILFVTIAVSSTRDLAVPSAKRVTISWPTSTPPALRTNRPSGVVVKV